MVSWWKDEREVGFIRLWRSKGKQPGYCGQGKLEVMGAEGHRRPPRLGASLHPPPLGWTLVWQGWGVPQGNLCGQLSPLYSSSGFKWLS